MNVLVAIFENVLQTGPLDAHTNFFETGGDSVRAVQAAKLIQEATGRRMPVSALREAPTPAELAYSLPARPVMAGRQLVTLHKGTAQTPLFLVFGVGGPALDGCDLSNTPCAGHTVYGLQVEAPAGHAAPPLSVERLAAQYLADVRRVQPVGPYAFAGFAFGGLVALEMARAVRAVGERVALVALVDSFPDPECWGLRSRIATWLPRRLRAGPPVATAWKTGDAKANLLAAEGYHPAPYPGHVTFFRGDRSAVLPSNPAREWERFATSVEVIDMARGGPAATEQPIDVIAQVLTTELLPYPRIDLTMI